MKTMYITAVTVAFQSVLSAAEVKTLTMTEAVDLALKQNRSVKIARLEVQENQESQNQYNILKDSVMLLERWLPA